MAINYPASLDTTSQLPQPTTSNNTNNPSHAGAHDNESAAIIALETKVGTGSSTPSSGTVMRGTGAGTSSWAQVNAATDVTGTLPVANGGTGATTSTGTGATVRGTSPTLSGPSFGTIVNTGTLTLPTSTDTLVGRATTDTLTNKTLTTPVIGDFTSAQHDHSNAAGGGAVKSSNLNNPYKFSMYRNAALTITTGSFQRIPLDTTEFDTGSNCDITTNKGRFTAPVAGFYFFSWQVGQTIGAADNVGALYKNGSIYRWGSEMNGGGSGGSALVQLAANDYIELFATSNTSGVVNVGASPIKTGMSGFLLSKT